jgi:endo-1,4-beta-xylanase
MRSISFIVLCLFVNFSFAQTSDVKTDTTRGLKDFYHDYFSIGVAVSPRSITGEEGKFILKQFNSLTPENVMKPGPIHPEENRYHWDGADAIVNFAHQNHLKVRGHTLCWHQQTGDWFFKDTDGKLVSKEVLLQRLHDHINAVVSRYKGKVYAWDVVNEAIDDDPKNFLRNSLWYQICGEDFIIKAFEYAHSADPEAVLFYNDYNTERPEKRDRVFKLLQSLVDKKVPINGVGLQGHWSIFEPSENELKEAIQKFSSLGLQVQITELDVSVYAWEKLNRARRAGETDEYTPLLEKQQTEKYDMVFRVFRENKKTITGVTFWNVSDRNTWLDFYPVRGRKNYPLLFDQQYKPKKAYYKVTGF